MARIRAGGAGESLPEVVASGTISGLRGQEAQLAAREADLSKYHGDEYPELKRVRASLQKMPGQISREITRGGAAALQTVERLRMRQRSLQQSIRELTKQLMPPMPGSSNSRGTPNRSDRCCSTLRREWQKRRQIPRLSHPTRP